MGKRVKTGKFPWSIKGVSVEARDFVRTAAAERGITMGEWLTNVIQNETNAFESTRDNQQKTNDGFIIAEKDLELRGFGDLIGFQQSRFFLRLHTHS